MQVDRENTRSVRTVAVSSLNGAALLTPQQLAERLSVPTSWIREKCRHRALVRDHDPLPYIKLGRYIRFRWADVEVWLNRQATHDHGAGSRLVDIR